MSSEKTPKLALHKWHSEDPVLMDEFNFNFSTLDTQVSKNAAEISEDVFYDEIAYEKYIDSVTNTEYYITHVPHLDSKGEVIKLSHGFQNDLINSGVGETVRNFAGRKATSLAVNASIWDTDSGLIKGIQIADGKIIQSTVGTSYTLGIKSDNTLMIYPPTTTASTILKAGCVNAITGFFPMIDEGLAVNPSVYGIITNPSEPNPRNVIAQLPNKDLLFLTSEGRTEENLGFTYADVIRILLAKGVKTAYCLDGGGSTQTVVRGMQINNPIDGGGKEERKVVDFLYIQRPAINPHNFKVIAKDIGIVNKKVSDIAKDLSGVLLNKIPTIAPNIGNLNNIRKTNFYWCAGTALNAPTKDSSWGVIHFQSGADSGMQIAFPYHATLGTIMLRRTSGSMTSWTAWRAM